MPLLRFFFAEEGAKKKLAKRKRRKEDFASAEATADRGGSDKPLKRLERNFQQHYKNRQRVGRTISI